MASNIEIKAAASNFAHQQQIAQRLSDTPEQILEQEDTFYLTPNGRLKLRILTPQYGELIFYQRANQGGPRQSSYWIAPTGDPLALKTVLSAALEVRGVVKKRRRLYLVGQTRIHLDEVDGLGQFIELEYVMQPGETQAIGLQVVQRIIDQLQISPDDLVPQAYMDLLEARRAQH
jgi:adenylate cyclase class IV